MTSSETACILFPEATNFWNKLYLAGPAAEYMSHIACGRTVFGDSKALLIAM